MHTGGQLEPVTQVNPAALEGAMRRRTCSRTAGAVIHQCWYAIEHHKHGRDRSADDAAENDRAGWRAAHVRESGHFLS